MPLMSEVAYVECCATIDRIGYWSPTEGARASGAQEMTTPASGSPTGGPQLCRPHERREEAALRSPNRSGSRSFWARISGMKVQESSGIADTVARMSVWALFAIGIVGLLTLSVLVGLSIGAILGHISREVSELLDMEPWQRTRPHIWKSDGPEAPDPTWRQQPGGGLLPRLTNRA